MTFRRNFLLLALLITGALMYNMLAGFLVPILNAAVFATLFSPVHERLVKLVRQPALAALLTCLLVVLILIGPIYLVVDVVAGQAVSFFKLAASRVQQIIDLGDAGLLGKLRANPFVAQLLIDQEAWSQTLRKVTQQAGTFVVAIVDEAAHQIFLRTANIVITLFTLFYLLLQGPAIRQALSDLIPLDESSKERLIERFIAVSRATVTGSLLLGGIQAILGAVALWVCGFGQPVMWAFVMFVCAIVPMVGAWLVLYPAAIYLIVTGQVWLGIGLMVYGAAVVGTVDNLLRPRLVRGAGLHDLLIFFTTLGGLGLFGPMGVVTGPILGALFVTLLEIYQVEFDTELKQAQGKLMS